MLKWGVKVGGTVTYYRDTYLDIHLDSLEQNVNFLRSFLPPHINIMAVVKADAYGHGAFIISQYLQSFGIHHYAVATLEEAIELRHAGIRGEILLLGPVSSQYLPLVAKHNLTLTIHDLDWLKALVSVSLEQPIPCHIDLDTGMHRIGLLTKTELLEAMEWIRSSSSLRLTGIYTHLATSEEEDETYYHHQVEMFTSLLKDFDLTNLTIHIANSGGTLKPPLAFVNMVRVGLFLHGAAPSRYWSERLPLQETLSLTSHIIQIKQLPRGEKLSYNGIYTTQEDGEIIATLPIGYADGFDRRIQNGRCYVNGDYGEVVGRVCMDFILIKLPKMVPLHTPVELIGPHISIDEYAEKINTNNYQAFCQFSNRLPRRYFYQQKLIATTNQRMVRKEEPYESH